MNYEEKDDNLDVLIINHYKEWFYKICLKEPEEKNIRSFRESSLHYIKYYMQILNLSIDEAFRKWDR